MEYAHHGTVSFAANAPNVALNAATGMRARHPPYSTRRRAVISVTVAAADMEDCRQEYERQKGQRGSMRRGNSDGNGTEKLNFCRRRENSRTRMRRGVCHDNSR